ncbi:MAG: hypothetical protein EG822_12635 [Deltaproteobacteria bacterium]|nr:hypothetical protein [Deltaproteobacteria bacterium]TLN03814.1 MAG: hypothetical protein FDZ73_06420 [bacterium]
MKRFNSESGGLDKKLSFRLDENQFGELLSWARREGFPVSTIVRHLVLRYRDDRRRFAKVM